MKRQYKIISCRVCVNILCVLMLLIIQGSLISSSAQISDVNADEKAQRAFARAVDVFDTYIGKNSFIYTGSIYYDHYVGIEGHQFFKNDYLEQGKVVYDGHIYKNTYLKYDVVSDQLLAGNFNSDGLPYLIRLYGPKVNFFSLQGYNFIRLETDTLSNIREGYFNLMYAGDDVQVLIERRKEIAKSNSLETVGEMFIEKDKYYIKKDGLFHQVRKKKSILKVLEDHKKEVKSFIRTNDYNFKFTLDEQLVEIVKYYDSLSRMNY